MKAGTSLKPSNGWPFLFVGLHSGRFILTVGRFTAWVGRA